MRDAEDAGCSYPIITSPEACTGNRKLANGCQRIPTGAAGEPGEPGEPLEEPGNPVAKLVPGLVPGFSKPTRSHSTASNKQRAKPPGNEMARTYSTFLARVPRFIFCQCQYLSGKRSRVRVLHVILRRFESQTVNLGRNDATTQRLL